MIDHISLTVSNAKKSQAFYQAALAPLGYKIVSEDAASFGIGGEDTSTLWVSEGKAHKPILHIAIRAQTRKQVDAFYKAALAAGGRDNGEPGVREAYAPTYYAAFVIDPDGNNLEAVCHSK